MKKSLQIVLSIATAISSASVLAGERVGDFALIDHLGAQHHMAWYDDQSAVVIVPQAVGATDPSTLDGVADLRSQFEQQGAVFFMLNPGLQTDREAVGADLAALGVDLPVLMDDTSLVAEQLGLTRLDEVVVYDPASFEISYRGPVQGETATAIQQLIDGVDADLLTIAGSGAMIETNAAEHANLSYADDIAPIIAENCAECHREGGVAPFAMDSKLAVQGWSPMIREVVMTKRMPPGQIDNKVGHKMKNEMNLSDEEMQKLVRWVNNGSNVSGDEDPLTSLVWPDTKWKLAAELGEPDLIVKIPPQAIPATGVVDYMDLPIDLGLTEDRWVKASEVAPDKAEVLHHIITTVIPPGQQTDPQALFIEAINTLPEERAAAIRAEMFAAVANGEQPNIDKIFRENPEIDVGALLGGAGGDIASVAGYAPGNSYQLNPDGVGGMLPAGTQLSLQMHYTTSGKEVTDETEIGIYFYPEGYVPEERMSGGVGNAFTIAIPAGAKDHEMELVTYVKNEAEIQSLMPHMHFRGKRMKFTAVYPDGTEELLLSVPAYSFNWQLAHELAEPLKVPAGTKIVANGAFDNSEQNPFNPDASIEINWGEQSWEEMFMGFYSWKETNQGGDD
ncbi:MAG: c-type cytochrome [Pseudomonadales bacterium]|nr:c-type cytochrome [Pseudomonadales bacterium]